jgi:hypothetical protein
MASVLLISKDRTTGDAICDVLWEAGHVVKWCRDPRSLDIRRAGKPGTRPPTEDTDLVIVDGWLAAGDEHDEGIASWHLVKYYRGLGLPVIALTGPDDLPRSLAEDSVTEFPRQADPTLIPESVDALMPEPLGVA